MFKREEGAVLLHPVIVSFSLMCPANIFSKYSVRSCCAGLWGTQRGSRSLCLEALTWTADIKDLSNVAIVFSCQSVQDLPTFYLDSPFASPSNSLGTVLTQAAVTGIPLLPHSEPSVSLMPQGACVARVWVPRSMLHFDPA